jgi:hypothetical protein
MPSDLGTGTQNDSGWAGWHAVFNRARDRRREPKLWGRSESKYRAIVRLSAGAVRAAIADFTESIRLNKDDAFAYAGGGWACNFSQETHIRNHLARFITRGPNSLGLGESLGLVFLALNREWNIMISEAFR